MIKIFVIAIRIFVNRGETKNSRYPLAHSVLIHSQIDFAQRGLFLLAEPMQSFGLEANNP